MLARFLCAGLVLAAANASACKDGGTTDETDGPEAGSAPIGGSGAGIAGGGESSTGGSPPVGESITLTLEPFDVEPGTERQVCKYFNLPADVPFDAVRFHSEMAGTSHHLNVYKFLSDPSEPVTAAQAEVHDCQPGGEQLAGDAAYIFGSATPERTVDMPPGVAFHLVPQQRIILEQHVINATSDVIQGGVSFEMSKPEDEASIEHHADVIWFANWTFLIPPNQETTATNHCTVPYDVRVFGLMSHTHALGSHFSIEKWSGGETEHLYESEDWAHPLYQEHDPHMLVAAGEGFEWSCTWNNTTGSTVFPGKSSTDEMCMTFAYAYPADGMSGDPIQCNIGLD
jgi:hypothetical protein